MRFYAGPRVLVIDEFGYRRLSEDGNAALFQVISQRYLKSSVALTFHVGIASWADQSRIQRRSRHNWHPHHAGHGNDGCSSRTPDPGS
jgi:DNA replication protein DnaC